MQKFIQCIFSPRYLLATNAILGTSFMLAGDLIAQELDIQGFLKPNTSEKGYNDNELVKKSSQRLALDPQQSKAMAAGGLYFGVTCHYWYLFLDKRFQKSKHSVMKKLLCESAVGPLFAAGLFAITGTVKRQSLIEITNDFKNSILYIVAADLFFFVPLQSINFYFLPTRYRFLYVGFITLAYDVFLSHVINNINRVTQPEQTYKRID